MEQNVKIFMQDNCTKAEAERFIKQGSEVVNVVDWEQYAKDNDQRNEDGEYITLDDLRGERDISFVKFEGQEYILLYVL